MKQGVYFFIIFSIIFILNLVSIDAINITGKTITGKPLQYIGLNITVMAVPSLQILSPENGTYLTNNSLLLNYSVSSDANSVWYSLDGTGNITITSPIFFNVSEGAHSLVLYANNSFSYTAEKEVSFSVNNTLFIILRSEYNGTTKGASTDFIKYTYEKLQNLSNVTLETTDSGEILFNRNINLTDDENFNDHILDLDKNTNISSNRIELNSTALPNFNTSATLSLYGLTFSNPRILINGVVCPSEICTKDSYSGGTLIFNVTGFNGIYSAEETPTGGVTPPSGGGGGGGGGGIIGVLFPKASSFSINVSEIKVSTTPGTVVTEQILITNNQNQSITLNLSQKDLDNFVVLKDNQIDIGPRESKVISLDFIVREGTTPDLYLGKIILTNAASKDQTELLTVVEVVSEGALLDVSAEIQAEYRLVSPGHDILAKISLFNVLATNIKRDIAIEYIIKDSNGNQISEDKETVSIETQTGWIKRIQIPEGTPYGKYVLYVKATTQDGKVASATDTFNVVASQTEVIYIFIIILVIVIAAIVIYFGIKQRNQPNKITKEVNVRDMIRR